MRAAIAETIGLREVLVFGGLSAIAYGVAQMHVPSAWIVVGGLLLLLGLRR